MIHKEDSKEFLKKQADFSADIIYSDPPYALGSEIIVREDGKVDYHKASDFMDKWDMPTGEWWEDWFKEAFRTLKYGGHCVMFGMDRQLLLFKYYAHLAGFTEKQSMYWYFISNFPKATDLSKMIDKNKGAEREVVGEKIAPDGKPYSARMKEGHGPEYGDNTYGNYDNNPMETAPSTPLAKKYNGYKYSIAPLKQTNETIMVFQKPYKTGSGLHDTLEMEEGNEEITCGAVDVDGNRVEASDKTKFPDGYDSGNFGNKKREADPNPSGRYPSQTYCDTGASEVLDEQSGVRTSGARKAKKNVSENGWGFSNNYLEDAPATQGGCSKILHKCDFEEGEFDLYHYQPKVSKAERNKGLGFDSCGIIVYNLSICEKNTTKGVKKAQLQVDTEQLTVRVIDESGIQKKSDLLWNIAIFMKNIMEKSLKDMSSTTKTKTSWTTELKTLSWLMQLLTKESIQVANSKKTDGGSLVVNVKELYTNQSFIDQKKGGLSDNVKSAESKLQLEINAEELRSSHPTLKPIALNEKILRLFKTPNEQRILYPFAGAGSEIIGGIKAGFDNWEGCELSEEYIKIAEARIDHWSKEQTLF